MKLHDYGEVYVVLSMNDGTTTEGMSGWILKKKVLEGVFNPEDTVFVFPSQEVVLVPWSKLAGCQNFADFLEKLPEIYRLGTIQEVKDQLE